VRVGSASGTARIEAVIRDNLNGLNERISAAAERAGRAPEGVKLIPVTKTVGVSAIRALIALGYGEVGENRVEVAGPKIETLGDACRWHMVGRIQRRKARDVAALFDRIDSLDRLSLAEELEKRCAAIDKIMPVLVQVNVSGEDVKGGFATAELGQALEAMEHMPHLRVEGLMTMAPNYDDPELTRPVFAKLRELANRHDLTALSMGMTNDFEVAVEEGATEVRIGTALFKGLDPSERSA
jgi:pyridoxal phosphate enzyme (YggS family)